MGTRLIIEGNAVYEIDEDCQAFAKKQGKERIVSSGCGCTKKKQSEKEEKKRENL